MQVEEPSELRAAERVQAKQPRPLRAEAEAPLPRPLQAAAPPSPRGRRPWLVLGLLVAGGLLAFGVVAVLTAGRESTDDAQVAADLLPVSTRVGGLVQSVAIHEDQRVQAGELIAQIDPAEYLARVRQAEAELESAKAQAASVDAEVAIVTARSTGGLSSARAAYSGSSVGVASAQAELAAARAGLVGAQAEARKAASALGRAQELRAANAVAPEALDNAQAAHDAAQASVARAQAQIAAAEEAGRAATARISEAAGRVAQSEPIAAQIAAATANATLAHARVGSRAAELELAQLQLSYTKIVAPVAGVASQLAVHQGQLLAAGQPLVEIVPEETYVVANFKETQLSHLRVGQRATIDIDAYPRRKFEGKVLSISGGTGASFALLPADNASGNFVKVVQRVPVRIGWVQAPTDVALRAGLSVNAVVYDKP
ncbi:MAG: rane fusion component of tripartite multidrug resistance system [Pseudomonadota bacterium]|jgi:membrane fusion protein (multidrug efflux system)